MTSKSAVDGREFSVKSGWLQHSNCFCCSAEPQDERAPSAGAKSLAIPFDQARWSKIEHGTTKCPACGKDAKRWTMFGRSY